MSAVADDLRSEVREALEARADLHRQHEATEAAIGEHHRRANELRARAEQLEGTVDAERRKCARGVDGDPAKPLAEQQATIAEAAEEERLAAAARVAQREVLDDLAALYQRRGRLFAEHAQHYADESAAALEAIRDGYERAYALWLRAAEAWRPMCVALGVPAAPTFPGTRPAALFGLVGPVPPTIHEVI